MTTKRSRGGSRSFGNFSLTADIRESDPCEFVIACDEQKITVNDALFGRNVQGVKTAASIVDALASKGMRSLGKRHDDEATARAFFAGLVADGLKKFPSQTNQLVLERAAFQTGKIPAGINDEERNSALLELLAGDM